MSGIVAVAGVVVAGVVVFVVFRSVRFIGAAEVGLVNKRIGLRKLRDDNPIAFRGEAGYQARLLMPGLRFKLWPIYTVRKFPWVQVPAGEVGVVMAQVGQPLPIGAKSAVYRSEFRYGMLHRSVRLPANADEAAITATYDRGILEITVPLTAPEPAGRQIAIAKK